VAKYALDTNVLIDALNVPSQLEALLGFLSWALPVTYLSAVVLHELAAGTTSARQRALLAQQITGPFVRRSRLLTPSAGAWLRAGELIGQGHRVSSPAALNDLLLAISCREAGLTVITRDRGVRGLARLVRGLRVLSTFPASPARVSNRDDR
jgi:predicted nucleic acid-binding protein